MRALVVSILLTSAGAALAQAAPDLRAAGYLAANCANCHGTEGRAVAVMPALAGLNREVFIQTMRDFRDNKRAATLMHQIAKGYTDEQIALMAEFFSRQKAK
jgi:cytochrome subunit of sulfide dehydrogenase